MITHCGGCGGQVLKGIEGINNWYPICVKTKNGIQQNRIRWGYMGSPLVRFTVKRDIKNTTPYPTAFTFLFRFLIESFLGIHFFFVVLFRLTIIYFPLKWWLGLELRLAHCVVFDVSLYWKSFCHFLKKKKIENAAEKMAVSNTYRMSLKRYVKWCVWSVIVELLATLSFLEIYFYWSEITENATLC